MGRGWRGALRARRLTRQPEAPGSCETCASSSEQRFVVSNTADLPSGPLSVYLSSADFSLLEPAQGGCASAITELQGAGRCELSVGFTPARRGPSEVTVTVDSALGAVSARLVGRGRAPAQLALSTDALDFERVVLGQSNAGTARIENAGDEPLSLASLGLAGEHVGDFAIQESDCGSDTSLTHPPLPWRPADDFDFRATTDHRAARRYASWSWAALS